MGKRVLIDCVSLENYFHRNKSSDNIDFAGLFVRILNDEQITGMYFVEMEEWELKKIKGQDIIDILKQSKYSEIIDTILELEIYYFEGSPLTIKKMNKHSQQIIYKDEKYIVS